MNLTDSQEMIAHECREMERVLLEKNRQYGDSALEPVRIFSNADPVEQLRVRIDVVRSVEAVGGPFLPAIVRQLIGAQEVLARQRRVQFMPHKPAHDRRFL